MTEKELKKLKFKKRKDTSDQEHPFHYYIYDVAHGLELITDSSDEIKNDEWTVEFFDTEPNISFTEFKDVKSLINILEKAKKNDNSKPKKNSKKN